MVPNTTIPCSGPSDSVTPVNSNLTLLKEVPVPAPSMGVAVTDGDGCSTPPVPGSFSVSVTDDSRTLDDNGSA